MAEIERIEWFYAHSALSTAYVVVVFEFEQAQRGDDEERFLEIDWLILNIRKHKQQ